MITGAATEVPRNSGPPPHRSGTATRTVSDRLASCEVPKSLEGSAAIHSVDSARRSSAVGLLAA